MIAPPALFGGKLWLLCGRFGSLAGFKLMDPRFLIADIRSECGSFEGNVFDEPDTGFSLVSTGLTWTDVCSSSVVSN